jgi:hypothetical protein
MTFKTWFKSLWTKPAEVPQESPLEVFVEAPKAPPVVKNLKAPNISDYPASEYSAYWEIIPKNTKDGWEATVRYYKWAGGSILAHWTYPGKTREEVLEACFRNVRIKMANFKE